MSGIVNIQKITEHDQVVYYPELGYMIPREKNFHFGGDGWINYHVNRHLNNIRLLSLYFDKVFLPLSHLHISTDKIGFEVTKKLLAHKDIKILTDRNIIIAGAWGGSTPEEIREKQIDFLEEIKWPIKTEFCNESRETLSSMTLALRDVNSQVKDLKSGIENLLILNESKENFESILKVKELVKKSSHKNFPFLHEAFWMAITEDDTIPLSLKLGVIKSTNRIYFEAGESGNPGVILYHVILAEEDYEPRISKATNVNSLFYHPALFASFLKIFLGPIAFYKLYSVELEKILSIRDKDWPLFKNRYHNFISTLPQMVGNFHFAKGYSTENLSHELKSQIVQNTSLDYGSLISFILNLTKYCIVGSFPFLDKVPIESAGKVISGNASGNFQEIVAWAKHKEFRMFGKKLKKIIK